LKVFVFRIEAYEHTGLTALTKCIATHVSILKNTSAKAKDQS